jgi:hypothetical protein
MLSFYHIRVPASLSISQQGVQGPERGEIHAGHVCHAPYGARLRLAHPLRDLQHRETGGLREGAPQDGRAVPAAHCLNPYLPPAPRVPRIPHFQPVGIVGVRSLGCTTPAAPTPLWTAGPRTWSTTACSLSSGLRNMTRAEFHLARSVSCPTWWGHR